MGCIQEAIEPFAMPQDAHAQPRPERGGDANERVHGYPISLPVLDATDDRSRYSGGIGESLLRPSSLTTKRPQRQTKPHDIHAIRVWSPPLTPGLIADSPDDQPRNRSTPGASAPTASTIRYPTRSSTPAARCNLTLTPMKAISPYGLS
jgi:hypothetical protein